MIGYLNGEILETSEESLLISNQGVGYEVFVSAQTSTALLGVSETSLWIYSHIREDLFQLYGFRSKNEKQFFLSLLKVNGIGPKVAMKILGAAPLEHILQMIEDGDVRSLSKLPKVGKKTAEQIILDLKGKLVVPEDTSSSSGFSARSDIVSALVNLGFKVSEVEKVVAKMDASVDLEDGVKKGLQQLTSQF